jgi:hypothetical protein
MKARSLWSALMLTWLSAANATSLPDGPITTGMSVADHERGGETTAVADTDASDSVAGRPAAEDSSPEGMKAP